MRTRKMASIAAALSSAPAKLLLLGLQRTVPNALLVYSNMETVPSGARGRDPEQNPADSLAR